MELVDAVIANTHRHDINHNILLSDTFICPATVVCLIQQFLHGRIAGLQGAVFAHCGGTLPVVVRVVQRVHLLVGRDLEYFG